MQRIAKVCHFALRVRDLGSGRELFFAGPGEPQRIERVLVKRHD
jgi:hypothetical protein